MLVTVGGLVVGTLALCGLAWVLARESNERDGPWSSWDF